MATKALSYFKKYVAPDVMPCPDVIVERELVSTIMDFCKQTHVITKDFEVDLTDADIDDDLVNSIDVDIREFMSDYRPVALVRLNVDGVDYDLEYKELVNDITYWDSIKDDNVKYFYFVDANTIRIYDMDSGDDNLFIRLAVKPKRDVTAVDEVLFDDHIETIAAGAKYRILAMPGKAWTNTGAANTYYREYRRGLTKARVNFDKGYTRQPGNVYPRSFGNID